MKYFALWTIKDHWNACVQMTLFPPSNSMNTPLTRRFCFVSTLLPTGLFPAGYADSVDLELDLIGKEGCIGMESQSKWA